MTRRSVCESRKLAYGLRFSKDAILQESVAFPPIDEMRDQYLQDCLLINENITPAHDQAIEEVCEKLLLPREAVSAFIRSSSEINAHCTAVDPTECVLFFTSGLVNLLSLEEFSFIVGHEIGHFLMQHYMHAANKESVEYFMQSKYQEISADRFGYIVSKNLDTAASALIKIMSGLDSEHLRLDMSQFLSQASMISKKDISEDSFSTHPSILFRCRALLWCSIHISGVDYPENITKSAVDKIDLSVEKDLHKYVEGQSTSMIDRAITDVFMWESIAMILRDDKFNKSEQSVFSELFGEDILDKMKAFLSNQNTSQMKSLVGERAEQAKSRLHELIPITFDTELQTILKHASKQFSV